MWLVAYSFLSLAFLRIGREFTRLPMRLLAPRTWPRLMRWRARVNRNPPGEAPVSYLRHKQREAVAAGTR
jgi:hypothetical protein